MTQETLKPCPFCGGHARPMKCKVGIEGTMGCNEWVTITCSMCEINNGGKGGFMRPRYDTEEEAAKAWNTRADKAVLYWQPIETAPKDGTEVILSKWSGSYATPETSFCWAINGYFKDGYWYSKDPIIGKLAEPTHWMLLSQPPKEEINHD